MPRRAPFPWRSSLPPGCTMLASEFVVLSDQAPSSRPISPPSQQSAPPATPLSLPSLVRPRARRAETAHRAGNRRGLFPPAGATRPARPSPLVLRPGDHRTRGRCRTARSWPMRACRHPPHAAFHRLPPGLQLRRPRVAFLGVLLFVADAQPPGLGAHTGPDDEPAEGQGCLRRVAEAIGDHGCP